MWQIALRCNSFYSRVSCLIGFDNFHFCPKIQISPVIFCAVMFDCFRTENSQPIVNYLQVVANLIKLCKILVNFDFYDFQWLSLKYPLKRFLFYILEQRVLIRPNIYNIKFQKSFPETLLRRRCLRFQGLLKIVLVKQTCHTKKT